MIEKETLCECYIGRLVEPEDKGDYRDIFYLGAHTKGWRTKGEKRYPVREWHTTYNPEEAEVFAVEDYDAGNVRAILKATSIVKEFTSLGYELHILRYRLVREMMQVGEHAHPLVQLAMLGD